MGVHGMHTSCLLIALILPLCHVLNTGVPGCFLEVKHWHLVLSLGRDLSRKQLLTWALPCRKCEIPFEAELDSSDVIP